MQKAAGKSPRLVLKNRHRGGHAAEPEVLVKAFAAGPVAMMLARLASRWLSLLPIVMSIPYGTINAFDKGEGGSLLASMEGSFSSTSYCIGRLKPSFLANFSQFYFRHIAKPYHKV